MSDIYAARMAIRESNIERHRLCIDSYPELDYTPCQRNHYEQLVNDQKIALIPAFTLESGRQLTSVPVAYKTWVRMSIAGMDADADRRCRAR